MLPPPRAESTQKLLPETNNRSATMVATALPRGSIWRQNMTLMKIGTVAVGDVLRRSTLLGLQQATTGGCSQPAALSSSFPASTWSTLSK